RNMADQFIASTVKASIYKLIPENRLIRERLWEQADIHVMSKNEFIKNFPYDEYAAESDFKTWEKSKDSIVLSANSNASGEWNWSNHTWTPGFYAIEWSSKDAFGEEVKMLEYVEIFDSKNQQLNQPQYLWATASTQLEP